MASKNGENTINNMNTQNEITQLKHRLQNNPNGIAYKDLPTNECAVNYMKSLLSEKKAVWLQFHGNEEFYFILIREPHEAPMGVMRWIWQHKEGEICRG